MYMYMIKSFSFVCSVLLFRYVFCFLLYFVLFPLDRGTTWGSISQIEALSLDSLKQSAEEYREHFSRALGRAIQGTIKVGLSS